MGNFVSSVPSTVSVCGIDISIGYVAIVGLVTLMIFCGCICVKCSKPQKPTTGETFKWPSSSRFMKRIDPSQPPMLVNSTYEDPIRTDVIPEDEETLWKVKYQPNGERGEVTQYMYLRFRRGGNVHGVGYEESRKLCKITGKYKLNARTNQTALALQCNFSNECDTVLFHGWGNGTGLVGNCFVREIDPFSSLSGIPGIRQLRRDKYKGSFLMLKQEGMGGAKLRSMVHTRRVHKWAGDCYPDDSVPMPQSPMRSPGATPRGRGGGRETGYFPVEGQGSTRGGHGGRGFARSTARPASPATSQGGSKESNGLGKKIRRFFHRKKPTRHVQLQDRTSNSSSRGGTPGEVPPWVRQERPGSEEAEMTELREGYHGGHARRSTGYDDDDGNGNEGSLYGYSPSSTSRPSTAGGKRSNSTEATRLGEMARRRRQGSFVAINIRSP